MIVTGPFLPRPEHRKSSKLARGLSVPVHVIRTVPDSLSYIGAADVVIAMAGYNTTAEILTMDKPALLVPRSGPSAEQQMRAKLFADRGWVNWLPPADLSPDMLAQAALSALTTGRLRSSRPDLRGRYAAAQHLLTKLDHAEINGAELNGAGINGSVINGTGITGTGLNGSEMNGSEMNGWTRSR